MNRTSYEFGLAFHINRNSVRLSEDSWETDKPETCFSKWNSDKYIQWLSWLNRLPMLNLMYHKRTHLSSRNGTKCTFGAIVRNAECMEHALLDVRTFVGWRKRKVTQNSEGCICKNAMNDDVWKL